MKVLIGCDVDPVMPAKLDGRTEEDIWRPLELVQELREMLADAMPPVTWLIRSDESVRHISGAFDSGFTARARMWNELLESGHELGWHMHILSRSNGGLALDHEPAWLDDAYAALARHYEVRATRTGWDYGSNFLFSELARLGVRVDFSALPGYHVWMPVGREQLVIDWVGAPKAAYRMSRDDYRKPGGTPLDLLEVPVSMFRNPPLGCAKRYVWRLRHGYLSPSGVRSKMRLITDPWDDLPETPNGIGVFYFHPDNLESDGIRQFAANVRRLRQDDVEFVTASTLLESYTS
jgi:hypothetical protein